MKKISIIIIVMISILMPSIVFAASAFQVGLASDKTEVKEGETVTISISLANLNVTTGEQGIGAYLAKIEYDTEIFEKAVFSGNTNWEGSMKNGNITGVTIDGEVVKQAEIIATLSLTVKENAKAGNTTVTISNFVGSDAVNDISANSKSIDIKVIEENKNQNQEDSNKNETNVENNTNTESNVTDNNNTNSDASDNTNSNNNANNNNSNNNGNTSTTDTITNNNNSNNNSNTSTTDTITNGNNSNNNGNTSTTDTITNSNNSNNNGNTSTTDTIKNNTISNEQLPQSRDKKELYGVFIAILLVLIIVIYIYHRKVKLKGKSSKYKENSSEY